VAAKVNAVELRPIVGVTEGAVTVNDTGMVTEVTPGALNVTEPGVCGPAVNDPVVTLTVTVPLPVPEAGLTVSQGVASLALQLKVPPPVLLRFTV
jgi:hypothetical protein